MKAQLITITRVFAIILFLGIAMVTKGQNVAITDDETYSANSAAMLDIKSETKGLLIPRVPLSGNNTPIAGTKPEGLLVWNTLQGTYSIGYYYWNGTAWSPVGSAVGNGLTYSGSTIEFGGALTKNTTLATSGFGLNYEVNGANPMTINLSSTGDFILYDNSSTYSCFTFQDNGRVGIGTTTPLHSLHIRDYSTNTTGTDGVYVDIQNRYNYTYEQTGIRFANNSGTTNTFRAGIFYRRTNSPVTSDGDLYLANNSGADADLSDAALIIKPNKTIGIGVDLPEALLHVKGDLHLASGVAVNEFSSDATLAGNSNLAVPTEYAVKKYVDNNAGAGHTGTGTLNYIPRWTSSTGLGNSILYQNLNKIGIGTTAPTSKLVVYGNNGLTDDDPIFEVKNDAGQTVFAVYPKGVRIYVDESIVKDKAAGSRGGFAVGNLSTGKSDEEFLRVTRDSVRIYVSETTKAAGSRGGFAVGNLSTGKATSNLMQIEKENYFIGHNSGTKSTGQYNNFFGYEAGRDNTTGVSNIFIGYWAGLQNTTGRYNVNIGNASGYFNQTGENNVNIGLFTGAFNKSSTNNIFIGNYAGAGNPSYSGGVNNIFLGVSTGQSIRGGYDNVLIGKKAGFKITDGFSNVIIGDSAGYDITTGYHNSIIGSEAGVKITTNNENSYFGYRAGISMNGTRNTFIGSKTGGASNYATTTPGTGGYNTTVGYYGTYALTTGIQNATIGCYAGYNISDGSNNTMVGYYAGGSNNGSGNVFIGSNAGNGTPFTTVSNKLVIHNAIESSIDNVLIYGEFDNVPANQKLQINGSVGINTAASSGYGLYVDMNDTPGSNTGVYGLGGYYGIRGSAYGDGAGTAYGAYGYASGASYNRGVYGYGYGGTIAYGVYGYAYGGSSDNYAGYFSGTVRATSFTTTSDFRMKKNIKDISGALSKLNKIRGVYYEWDQAAISNMNVVEPFLDGEKNGEGKKAEILDVQFPKGIQVGVIAQEVETILPEAVFTDSEGLKSVDYSRIIPLLIQAINEQQVQIQKQNDEIEQLKAAMGKSSDNK